MLIQADAAQIPLADESVQCIVTSPPYWGLRDYGTAKWEGGDVECDHIEMSVGMSDKNTLGPDGYLPPTNAANVGRARQFRDTCRKCGAKRIDRQLGLEPTPELYVANMVAVFRECWRVLRKDGTVWCNLGDSYARDPGKGDRADYLGLHKNIEESGCHHASQARTLGGLKPKDLVGIPWRVAFALQAAGWYLRSDIIWSKPNPMPESVTDRPTKAHEYLFLLAKRERYYFDQDAVREDARYGYSETTGLTAHEKWDAAAGTARQSPTRQPNTVTPGNGGSRNIRSVWTIATQSFPDAHFATFPEDLVKPCILAGTSHRGCCPKCGAPWERMVEKERTKDPTRHTGRAAVGCNDRMDADEPRMLTESRTLGWEPGCECSVTPGLIGETGAVAAIEPFRPVACRVLDPFAGSGTVVKVAQDLGRVGIGLDLKPEYLKMGQKRISQLGFGAIAN